MAARGRWGLGWVALALVGCGAAPTATLPEGAVVLQGAEARWEPSGAHVVDDTLWVVNDKAKTLAAFALPLKAHNAATRTVAVATQASKLEALAPGPDGGLLVWEVMGPQLVACARPDQCAQAAPVADVADRVRANAWALAKAQGRGVHAPDGGPWINVEGLARRGDRTWFGVRQYFQSPDRSVPFSAVIDDQGRVAYGGRAMVDDGRAYGISGLAFDGDAHLWILWSHEAGADTRQAVSGWLTRATLDAQGMPGVPQRCYHFGEGKPEGVAVWGDRLVVVFDNDKARKGPGAEQFPVQSNQDFAVVLDKPACERGPVW